MKKKSLKENLTLMLEGKAYVSYADYAYRIPPFSRIVLVSSAPENVEVSVRIVSDTPLFLSNETKVVLPFESEVSLESRLLNPAYLASLTEETVSEVTVFVEKNGEVVLKSKVSLNVLPYDTYGGISTETEYLCGFVRTGTSEQREIVARASEILKGWGLDGEFNGYDRNKNTTLRQFASLYASIKQKSYLLKGADYSSPVSLNLEGERTTLDLALLMAGCLESVGLYPVLLIGKDVAVGVWLYEGCFYSTVMDDLTVIENYTSDGVHNLCFVRASDLFGTEDSFSRATEKFRESLKDYEYSLDIRRGRLGGYRSLPLRVRAMEGVELVETKELDSSAMPSEISELNLSLEKKLPKNKQWERRLLDLSFKNPLLNFNAKKNALPISVSTLDDLSYAIVEKGTLKLFPSSAEEKRILTDPKLVSSFAEAELTAGNLRTVMSEEELSEMAGRIIRKGKEADEESGGNLIYLAFGFLHYLESGKEMKAPLLLLPVRLRKTKGNNYFLVEAKDELSVNTTLLEFLKQAYDIDVRGLDQSIEAIRMQEIFAMIRREISHQKGWTVEESCYLSVFSFTRYFLWNDVRKNIDFFRTSPIVNALLTNTAIETEKKETKKREEYKPYEILTPLSMDESQFDAVALSKTGTSFVLHGPPGTGKSQTITNIIGNALADGKRVLFVAEKEAALSVVKRRLEAIGVGEFCLELHSSRVDKGEVVKRIEDTLSLNGGLETFLSEGDQYAETEDDIARVYRSLHKVRRIGVSVYEGMIKYLENKSAPDLLGIDSGFYDTLNKEKIAKYESLLLDTAFSANECGGVGLFPFEGVELGEYSSSVRDEVYCVSKCILSEIAHLKGYLALFTAQYRQTVSVITTEKLKKLKEIARILLEELPKIDAKEEEFKAYFHANMELKRLRPLYDRRFKKFISIKEEITDLNSWTARSTLFKLNLCAKEKLEKEEQPAFLKLIWDIQENEKIATSLTYSFSVFEKLHILCEECFLDYNPDTFNSMLVRTAEGSTKSVLFGLIHAVDGFADSLDTFLKATNLDEKVIRSDDLFRFYAEKATALLKNIDRLGSWCKYKATAYKLKEEGLSFMVEGMESGKVDPSNIVSCFEKHVYRNFLDTFFTSDEVLAAFSGASLDEKTNALKRLSELCREKGKKYLRTKLISSLPSGEEEGPINLELLNFKRFASQRGGTLNHLMTDFPLLLARTVPCMLMSPTTVSTYLPPEQCFDLVIFDEASQLPTAEAIGSLARAKSAIIVGDPNQLPPTSFFSSGYVDEDNLENEDLESILDDALAIGMTEKYLTWHYRSRHESLIAFSNVTYYQGRLSTFPSPDSMESKVKFRYVENGVYDRGFTKRNQAEAVALIEEVIARLKRSKQSIGIVTFSSVQKEYIERLLQKEISKHSLEAEAYDREEPIFVKNLENVQGDERDVILFSICYGPDRNGRISLNFGPLNQTGGWRRLNVAVSRAKEEMVVFASMTSAMIDLSKTTSKGVAGLKGFLEFASRGKLTYPAGVRETRSLGKFIASDLSAYGYECRCDVGVSSFKIDVAVVDPKNPDRFILAILGDENGSVYDTAVLEPQALRLADWNVVRVYSVSYFTNPQKEIKKLRELLDKLTGTGNRRYNIVKMRQSYKTAEFNFPVQSEDFIVNAENDRELMLVLKKVIAQEEPVEEKVLVDRVQSAYGVTSSKAERKLKKLLAESNFKREKMFDRLYFYGNDRATNLNKYRVVEEGDPIVTPYDVFSLIKCLLENRIALDWNELYQTLVTEFHLPDQKKTRDFLEKCLDEGVKRGYFMKSVAGRVMLS